MTTTNETQMGTGYLLLALISLAAMARTQPVLQLLDGERRAPNELLVEDLPDATVALGSWNVPVIADLAPPTTDYGRQLKQRAFRLDLPTPFAHSIVLTPEGVAEYDARNPRSVILAWRGTTPNGGPACLVWSATGDLQRLKLVAGSALDPHLGHYWLEERDGHLQILQEHDNRIPRHRDDVLPVAAHTGRVLSKGVVQSFLSLPEVSQGGGEDIWIAFGVTNDLFASAYRHRLREHMICAVEITNQSFARIGIPGRLRTYEIPALVNIDESKITSENLCSLQRYLRDNGTLNPDTASDFLLLWLAALAGPAQIQILLTLEGDTAGAVSSIGGRDSRSCFAVVRWPFAITGLTLAHEIGHLLGARHDLAEDPRGRLGHGHTCSTCGVRSIMALDSANLRTRRVALWAGSDEYENLCSCAKPHSTRQNVAEALQRGWSDLRLQPLQSLLGPLGRSGGSPHLQSLGIQVDVSTAGGILGTRNSLRALLPQLLEQVEGWDSIKLLEYSGER